MLTYCIIPDNPRNFLALIDGLPIEKEAKESLKRCSIAEIHVNTKAKSWEIILDTSKALPENLLRFVAGTIRQGCGLEDVVFRQRLIGIPTTASADMEEFLTRNWQLLIDEISGENKAAKHLLYDAAWKTDNGRLSIEIVGDLSVELLTAKGIDTAIKNFLSRQFNKVVPVEFIAAKIESYQVCGEELLTPEYLEALQECGSPKKEKKSASPVIFGKNIKGEPQSINQIQDEGRNIVIEGRIVAFELRELRSGRFLFTFDVADLTDGISGKFFLEDQEEYKKLSDAVENGMWVKVKGTVQFDKFSTELTLFADSMVRIEKPERADNAATPRVELHAHTKMSSLDAVVSVKNLIKTAAKWGHPAIAITDHGVVQAFPEAAEEAAKTGIKVIYGMEGYLFDQEIGNSNHIVILARNSIGLRNLYRLVSLSHLKFLHRTPRIPRQALIEHREGLLFGSACEAGELIQAILRGAPDDELLRIAAFYDYLEIQPTGNNAFLLREGTIKNEDELRAINKKICQLGQKLDKPVAATCDVHFLNPEDEVYRRILMAGQGYSDADHQPPLFFRTTEEMLAEFSYLGKDKAYEVVVENPRRISDLIERIKPIPDELYSPKIPGAEDQIRTMAYQKAEEIYGNPLPEIVASRLKYELDSIINNGFAVLYLIAHKLVKKSLDDGYLVGSRGSVGSSFVATMTDITEVNPLPPHWRCPHCRYSEFVTDGAYGGGFDLPDKDCPVCGRTLTKDGHDIPFAVFMGFHGDKVPDIDLNFSGEYQPIAHKYTEELFGKDNVFRAGTIATIADKTAYGFVKNYFADKGMTPRNAGINRLVSGCTGVKRTTGQHPGGIMVVPRDMDVHHFTPIQYPADDKNSTTITTHFDYHSISSRLVKLDILGHDDPTVIKMLEDLTGVDAKKIPFDDQATISLFSSTEALKLTPEQLNSTVATFGIPEFGTKFVRQMLEDTKPKNFSELVRISGFSHGTDVWLNNAQDLIRNGVAKLSEAISARDDIMVYLIQKGLEPGLAFKIMEGVRKGKGVKSEDIEKMKAANVPDWYIESCQKIKYMFPKAHAVAYVMMAFRIAWFKVHYPLAFYAAYFSVRAEDFDAGLAVKGEHAVRAKLNEFEQKGNSLSAKEKSMQTILEMVLEMCLRGYVFHNVDLYQSDATKFLIKDNGLLPPLAALQGLGGTAAQNIVAARQERSFSSQEDLRARARISKTVVEILQVHGCLSNLPETDQIMLFA